MSTLPTSEPRASLWQTWHSQQAVLRGMIMREFLGRFGRNNIGFLWVIAEPLILASVITLIHLFRGGERYGTGMGPYPFTVLGYCLIIIFRNNFGRAAGTLSHSGRMLFHSQITPLDIMISRYIVETFGVLVAFFILMSGGILLGFAEMPYRFDYLGLGMAEIILFSFGMSCIAAVYAMKYAVVERLIQPFAYFMFPLSGAFFTMSFLPTWLRPYFAWNPMMVMFETARYGMFENASPGYIDTIYALGCCAIVLFWGLLALRLARPYIHAH